VVNVIVATRTLGAGAVLTPGSVRIARWPAALAPQGALTSAAAVIGRRIASPVGAGEVLTGARVSGSGVLQGQPAGTVAVHVPLADAAATAMVSPGDTVDLVGPDGVLARAVRVLSVDGTPGAAGGLMGSGSTGTDGGTGVVVGVDESEAALLARAPADAMGQPALMLVLRAA
jgi:Flp pilus assembly protein CpaB